MRRASAVQQASILYHASRYSSGVGSLPWIAARAASSAEARKTSAPLPRRLGKLRVEVETTTALSATRAWLPMQREQPRVVGVVGRAEDGLGELVHVDLDRLVVLGLRVGHHERGRLEPVFHLGDAPLEGAPVAVALGNHP